MNFLRKILQPTTYPASAGPRHGGGNLPPGWDIPILSFGLGFTLLWAGIGGFLHPENWIGFVPEWIENFGVSREFFLQAHSIFDVALALALIFNIYRRYAALLAGLFFLSIIVLYGIDDVTFRDVGLIAAAFVIFSRSNDPKSQ